MMEVSLVNSCILYNREKEGRSRLPLLDFRVAVATGLLEEHLYRTDRRHPAPTLGLPMRLFERRYPRSLSMVADHYVKYADLGGKGHKPPTGVKSAKLHYIAIHVWRSTTQNVTILNKIKMIMCIVSCNVIKCTAI